MDTPLPTASQCAKVVWVTSQEEEVSMTVVTIVELDLAKRVFRFMVRRPMAALLFGKAVTRSRYWRISRICRPA